jgi:hypothetical protein
MCAHQRCQIARTPSAPAQRIALGQCRNEKLVTRDCENRSDSRIVGSKSSAKRPIRTAHDDGRSTNCRSQIGFPLPSQENHRRSHRRGRNGCEPFPKAATYCHLLSFWTAQPLRAFQPLHLFSCPKWACRPAWAARSGTTRRVKMSVGDKRSACLPGKRLRPEDPTPIV